MPIVLLVLSGDALRAREQLQSRYRDAEFSVIAREQLETLGVAQQVRLLRSMHPDLFAIATERVGWQRGQDLLMLLGVLAGARAAIVFDCYGGIRSESRLSLLQNAPARLFRATRSSAAIVRRAKTELRQLERALEASIAERLDRREHLEIAYLRATPGPGTQAGGAASHIRGVINALHSLGAELQLLSNDSIAGLDPDFPMTIIEPELLGNSRAAFEINNNVVFTRGVLPLIESNPPSFIYQRYARFGWAGIVAGLRTNRPLFLEYNGSEVWVGRHWDNVGMLELLERYESLNLNGAARIFVVSEVERRNLERKGIASQKIIVNPNGVDTNIFRPGVGGERVRKSLGVASDEVLAGFVGSFGPWHGVLTLAEAIKLIPRELRIRFLFLGSGSLLSALKKSLAAEEDAGRVIITGAVAHDEVPSLLDACDLLLSPHVPLIDGSEFFGSPTKIFEYMAMGKGIVASRLGQIGEVLTHEKTALLVEPGDSEELRAAIVRLAECKTLREQLGAAARGDAIEHHTWQRNAQNVLDAYNAWLHEPNS